MAGDSGVTAFVADAVSWGVAACDAVSFGFAVFDIGVASVADRAGFDIGSRSANAGLALSCAAFAAGKVKAQKVFFTRVVVRFGRASTVGTAKDLAKDRGVAKACGAVAIFLTEAVVAYAGDLEALAAACADAVVAGFREADIAPRTERKTLSALRALAVVARSARGAGES